MLHALNEKNMKDIEIECLYVSERGVREAIGYFVFFSRQKRQNIISNTKY
jgi:hypothetical protein